MGILDKAIASFVVVVPRPIVRRISSRYMAGANLKEALPVIRLPGWSSGKGVEGAMGLRGEEAEF